MGGRVAELIIYGSLSTGANNDLVGNTELARKMVREWGMSDRVGPMAWGSQGQVFLGEDLMHTRDYSDETSRVIDEEVERILRQAEDRATEVLTANKAGLQAVAAALLEKETVDGAEIRRLVDEATRAVGVGGNGAGPAALGPGVEVAAVPPNTTVPLAPSATVPTSPIAPAPPASPPVVTTPWPGIGEDTEAAG
jgi:cell division protease FtsH